jgi:methylmalonyl-CoA/ethylmalonyl-CoA epimerase
MLKSINHIGIAVRDLDESIETFRKIFLFDEVHREIIVEQKVEIASFKVGDVMIELTVAIEENTTIAKFIEKRGEGIHHIAFETDDINKELERLSGEGIQLINSTATEGANNTLIAFLHPKSTNGVLVEICEKK